MKLKSIINLFIGLGAVVSVISFLWWGAVYSFVSKQNGENMWSSLNCVYSIGAECNVLRGMAWLRGINPYEPLLFWMGIVMLFMALSLKLLLKKETSVALR